MRSVTMVRRRSGRTSVMLTSPAVISAKPRARPTPRQRTLDSRESMKWSSSASSCWAGGRSRSPGPATVTRSGTRLRAKSLRLLSTAREDSQTETSTAAIAISVIAIVTRAPTLRRDIRYGLWTPRR